MLGDLIYEGRAKGSDVRMKSHDGRVEATFNETGKLKGIEVSGAVTWWSNGIWMPQEGEVMLGEGEGVFMTDRGEKYGWKGRGTIRRVGGKIIERGAIQYYGPSEGRLVFINGVIEVYELEQTTDLNLYIKVWEWK